MTGKFRILALTTALAVTFGCSKEEKTVHTGHEQHQTGAAPVKKEAQIYENGRVVVFDEKAPAISLVNQDGQKATNDDWKGKVVLINFIYTNCNESCPIMMHKFMEIEKELKAELGKNIQLVSITMDPERDTPEALKKYADKMNTDTSYWTFLTGEKSEIEKILKGFNFFVVRNEDGTFGHANAIVGLDRKGAWKYNFNVLTVPVDILVTRIKEELKTGV